MEAATRTRTRIRDAFDRMVHVFGKRPAAARATNTSTARLVDGLRCETQEGPWHFTMDMPVDVGGTGEAPTPGVHGRAALASCLAIGYAMHLARAGITVQGLEVEVQTESDHRGLVGLPGVKAGYETVRHTLYLQCDATPEQLQPVLQEAQRTSPYLNVFRDAQAVEGCIVFGPRQPA